MSLLAPSIEALLHPLFAALPLEQAMPALLGAPPTPALAAAHAAVAKAVSAPELRGRFDLQAGLWLYVGDFARAGQAATLDRGPAGAFWHALCCRRSGDYDQALLWYGRAAHHPAMAGMNLSGGPGGAGTQVAHFDPATFVAHVRRHGSDAHPPADLVALQQREWIALFHWCAENG